MCCSAIVVPIPIVPPATVATLPPSGPNIPRLLLARANIYRLAMSSAYASGWESKNVSVSCLQLQDRPSDGFRRYRLRQSGWIGGTVGMTRRPISRLLHYFGQNGWSSSSYSEISPNEGGSSAKALQPNRCQR